MGGLGGLGFEGLRGLGFRVQGLGVWSGGWGRVKSYLGLRAYGIGIAFSIFEHLKPLNPKPSIQGEEEEVEAADFEDDAVEAFSP